MVIFSPLVKNWKSFGNLHFWSLEFQILAEKVPGGIILNKKSFWVLGKLQKLFLVLGVKF